MWNRHLHAAVHQNTAILNPAELLTISCSYKNFMVVSQTVQVLTNTPTNGHYWKQCHLVGCRCVGSKDFNCIPAGRMEKTIWSSSDHLLLCLPTGWLTDRCFTADVARVCPRHCCYRIGPIHFLAGWHKRRPEPGLVWFR